MTKVGGEKVRRKCQGRPWPGSQSSPLGIIRRYFFHGWGGDDASRLPRRKFRGFSLTRGIPADASSANWSGPRANNRIFSGGISSYSPPSLKGCQQEENRGGSMRRKEFEVQDRELLEEVLKNAEVGYLAFNGGDGWPRVTPLNFVFDGRIL